MIVWRGAFGEASRAAPPWRRNGCPIVNWGFYVMDGDHGFPDGLWLNGEGFFFLVIHGDFAGECKAMIFWNMIYGHDEISVVILLVNDGITL